MDIDFGAVIRALAGLDSIANPPDAVTVMAPGPGLGNVSVVNPAGGENLAQLKDIVEGSDVANRVLDDFAEEPEAFDHDLIGLRRWRTIASTVRRKDEMNYPVTSNSSVGHDDDLFNLLALNTLAEKAHERRYHAKPELRVKPIVSDSGSGISGYRLGDAGVVVPYADGKEIMSALCDGGA